MISTSQPCGETLLFPKANTKIIISCLLVEDKDFLVGNEISLSFKSSEEQQPLHNYARFATELNLRRNLKVLTNLITNKEPYRSFE